MIVTDFVSEDPKYAEKKGFYMDGYLASNIVGIPKYLAQDQDALGIVSGHGEVRVGKSTIAFQIGTFIAWLNAGGKMKFEKVIDADNKEHWVIHELKHPTKKMHWSLKENVVFSARDLKKRATYLYNKYGRSQVIIYDEGRQGVSASRAMENLNKEMEDFFGECGVMGHIILIVIPNFFKLHEDYSVPRSLFLIDTFKNQKNKRGFFNFYNKNQKEWLYFLGKKKLGITQKYTAARESFWGRFSSWFPFNKEEYERLKVEALKKKEKSRLEQRFRKQADVFAYMLNEYYKVPFQEIADEYEKIEKDSMSGDNLGRRVSFVREKVKRKEKGN